MLNRKNTMTLTVTPCEIQNHQKVWRIGDKRLSEIKEAIATCEPIRIRPTAVNGRYYRLLIPKTIEPAPDKQYRLTFKPFWNRCYRGCHIRSDEIRLLVIELEDGSKLQFEPDKHTPSACSWTTSGAGVGRDAEEDAEALLCRLFGQANRAPILNRITDYMRSIR